MVDNDKKYYAFISYSHKDEEWANWLQHEFEHCHLPTTLNGIEGLPDNFRPIFRNIDESSGGELKPQITNALKSSAHLVIICSPNSAKSVYVNDEIREFIKIGKQNGANNISNIFPFIVQGIPHSKDNPANECFPQALKELPTELIAGDVTKHGHEHAFVKILSGTLHNSGVNFGMLWNQFERNRIEAERKEREQKEQLLRTQSLYLAEVANNLINDLEYDVANLIALEALPHNLADPNRPYVREAEDSLRKSSVYTSPIIRPSSSGKCIQTNGKIVVAEEDDCKLQIWNAKDGKHIGTIELKGWLNEYYKDMLDSHAIDSYILRNHWLKAIAFPKTMQNVIYVYTFDSLLSIDFDTLPIKPQLIFKRDSGSIAHFSHTADVIFSHDKRYYFWLTKESECRLCLYDNITSQEIFSFSNDKSSVVFSPNSRLIAFACHKDILVYDIENLKANNSCYLAKYRCNDPSFCTFADDTNILVVRGNNSIEIWDYVSKKVETIHTSKTNISDVLYRDNILVYVTSSNQIRVLDTQYRFMIAQLDWNSKVKLLSFSNDGDSIYFRDERSLRTWDFHTRTDGSHILYYHQNYIDATAYSQDMSYFVSIS